MASIKLKFRPSSVKRKKGRIKLSNYSLQTDTAHQDFLSDHAFRVGQLHRQSAYFNTV